MRNHVAAQSFNGLDMKNLYKGYLNAKPTPGNPRPVLQNSLMSNSQMVQHNGYHMGPQVNSLENTKLMRDPFGDDIPGPKDNSLVVGLNKDHRRNNRGQTAEGNRRKHLTSDQQKNRNILSKKE
jgi:hypothetical protein